MARIFISHSSRDDPFAVGLKERLRAAGHQSVFLDFDPADGIVAGREWEQELYRSLRLAQAVIVVCSQSSMASRWCFMEITNARASGKPLFAIRIDDASVDAVLTDRQVIDLREGEAVAFERLFRGLAAAGLDPAKTFARDASRPPYPGFLAFEKEDAAIFFGRDEEIAQGLQILNRIHHLGDPGVMMILGASGTGKSSLARAGLVARLERDSERWLIVGPLRPRANPLRSFAAALSDTYMRVGSPRAAEDLLTSLTKGDFALLEVAKDLRKRAGGTVKVLLVVDQFEELLGSEASGDVTPALTLLRAAAEDPGGTAIVLGTLRSDFLGAFQNSQPLLDLRYEVLSLGPMSEADIAEVIEGPARDADVEIEPALVRELTKEALSSNALPLLAFTLRELWERCAGDRRLSLDEHLRELGGMQMVVGKRAGEVLAATRLTKDQTELLRAAFLSMTRRTDDGTYVRRSVLWSDLPQEVHPILQRFVDARLLVSGTAGNNVEVAHERLFDSWPQLRQWLTEESDAIRIAQELDAASRSWADAKEAADHLWPATRARIAQDLIDTRRLLPDDRSRRFLHASESAATAAARRSERTRRIVISTISAIAVLAVILAVLAFYASRQQREAAIRAEERARLADIARAQALSAQNFAEYQRVLARAQGTGLSDDQRRALQAIAPKYLDQSKRYEAQAKKLDQELAEWRRRNAIVPPLPSRLFSLEIFRARSGTAFLIHYGDPANPRRVLVDGGDRPDYRRAVRPRLDELGGAPLPLSLVVASQTDIQHIGGLVELMREQETTHPPPYAIGTIWSNAFVVDAPVSDGLRAATHRKAQLVAGALRLGIPVNQPFSRFITLPEAGAARVRWDDDLSLTVLSPPVEWMREFADFWIKSWVRRGNLVEAASAPEPRKPSIDILETFASPRIELLPSPIEIRNPPAPGGTDRSLVNLGSIVLMVEMEGKKILLTADTRADVLLYALAQAGYTDEKGAMDVDVLVLPHGGSKNNVSEPFFRRIRASHYVISADGTFTNPRVDTLEMLMKARRGDRRPFTIHLTYRPAEYGKQEKRYPLDELCALFDRERKAGTPFQIVVPRSGRESFGIDLLASAPFVDKGTPLAQCRDLI